MSRFTEPELEYLKSQRLGRLATINKRGEPQNSPVGFRYNEELDTIDIGGYDMEKSQKFRNVAHNGRVSFVVDDVLPPWQPRMLEIRGSAEALTEGGYAISPDVSPALIRITPERIIFFDVASKRPFSARDV